MADRSQLDELITRQADPVARRLLQEFAKLIRDPNINASECPGRMRQVMDELFKEAAGAPAKPDSL